MLSVTLGTFLILDACGMTTNSYNYTENEMYLIIVVQY